MNAFTKQESGKLREITDDFTEWSDSLMDEMGNGIIEGWITPIVEHNYKVESYDEGFICRCQNCGNVLPYLPSDAK
jgi:hypothetical protein